MKKHFIVFTSILLVLLSFSCSNNAHKDSCGCFEVYDDALSYAGKKNLPMLIFFTSEGDDDASTMLVNDVIKDSSTKLSSKYAVLHADFSQNAYQKMSAPDDASSDQQQIANTYTTIMQQNYQLAILLNVSTMPAAFLCTKEGYVVSAISSEEITDKSSFINKLNSYNSSLERFNKLVAATKKGSAIEKVEAIDGLFMATNQTYRSFLLPLVQTAIQLDKENQTGLVGKFILAQAEAEAMNAYSQGDVETAVKQYLTAANNEFLKPVEKQECFYTAAYLVTASGSTDYDGIIEYMQTAYDLAPDSSKAEAIKNAITYFETVKEKALEYDGQDE